MRQHEENENGDRCKHCGALWRYIGSSENTCVWRTGNELPRERRISALDDIDSIFTRIEELRKNPED